MESVKSEVLEPAFWNQHLFKIPLCNELLVNFEKIKQEIMHFLNEKDPLKDFPQYSYYDNISEISRKHLYEHSWKALPLSRFIKEFDDASDYVKNNVEELSKYAQESLPFTYNLLQEYEQKDWLANVFISKLIPGSVIHPHHGRSDFFLRVHLCLIEDVGCNITVGGETQTWKEGSLLAFKDGGPYNHSVLHKGKQERIILSLDLRITAMRQFIVEL